MNTWKIEQASPEEDSRFGYILCYPRLLEAQIKLVRESVHTVEMLSLFILSHHQPCVLWYLQNGQSWLVLS